MLCICQTEDLLLTQGLQLYFCEGNMRSKHIWPTSQLTLRSKLKPVPFFQERQTSSKLMEMFGLDSLPVSISRLLNLSSTSPLPTSSSLPSSCFWLPWPHWYSIIICSSLTTGHLWMRLPALLPQECSSSDGGSLTIAVAVESQQFTADEHFTLVLPLNNHCFTESIWQACKRDISDHILQKSKLKFREVISCTTGKKILQVLSGEMEVVQAWVFWL